MRWNLFGRRPVPKSRRPRPPSRRPEFERFESRSLPLSIWQAPALVAVPAMLGADTAHAGLIEGSLAMGAASGESGWRNVFADVRGLAVAPAGELGVLGPLVAAAPPETQLPAPLERSVVVAPPLHGEPFRVVVASRALDDGLKESGQLFEDSLGTALRRRLPPVLADQADKPARVAGGGAAAPTPLSAPRLGGAPAPVGDSPGPAVLPGILPATPAGTRSPFQGPARAIPLAEPVLLSPTSDESVISVYTRQSGGDQQGGLCDCNSPAHQGGDYQVSTNNGQPRVRAALADPAPPLAGQDAGDDAPSAAPPVDDSWGPLAGLAGELDSVGGQPPAADRRASRIPAPAVSGLQAGPAPVGGPDRPALVYNGASIGGKPISELRVTLDTKPANIAVTLTWAGVDQQMVTFTPGSGGPPYRYDLGVPLANAVSSSGLYSVTMTALGTHASDTVGVLFLDNSPIGAGWSVAGVDQLFPNSLGALLVPGDGGRGRRFLLSGTNYQSPADDYGTLTHMGNTYTYTSSSGVQENFDSNGLETSLVDPHGVTVTFHYSGSLLSDIDYADGTRATFTYAGGLLSTIKESGGRLVTLTHSGSDLTNIMDVDGSPHTFTYDGTHHLTREQWDPLDVTFQYDPIYKVLSATIEGGSSNQTDIRPAVSASLITNNSLLAGQVTGLISNSVHQTATVTEDALGYLTRLEAPDGGVQTWVRDTKEQVINYSDWTGTIARTTTLAYDDTSGVVTAIYYPDGSARNYQYDGTYHHVTRIQDGLGQVSSFAYNGLGDLTTITYPGNSTTTFAWSSGLLQSVTDRNGNTTSFQYDTHRRLKAVGDALGGRTTLSYDSFGDLALVTNALRQLTTLVHDARDQLTSVTDPAGETSSFTYNSLGEITTVTDPRGILSSYSYDAHGRLSAVTEAATQSEARTTTLVYDLAGQLLSETSGISSLASYQHLETVSYAYDSVGRVTGVYEAFGAGSLQRLTAYAYDRAGNRVQITDPLGNITSVAFDRMDRPVRIDQAYGSSAARSTTMLYEAEGNVLSETTGIASTNAHVLTTSFGYDPRNRPTVVIEALGVTGLERRTTIAYDLVGNVTLVTDPLLRQTSSSYDALNRLMQVDEAAGSVVARSTTYLYDALGNVLSQTSGISGVSTYQHLLTVSFGYDKANRPTKEIDAFGTSVARTTTTGYDADGNVVSIIDGSGNTSTWTYDGLGRVVAATDARGYTVSTVYDAANDVLTVQDPDLNVTTFLHDTLGRVTQQLDALHNSSTFVYDAGDRLTSTTDRDGRRRDLRYDALGRETGETWVASGVTVNTLTYTYDAGDDLLTAANASGTYTLNYDALGRATVTLEPFGGVLTASYDAGDRRTSLQDSWGGIMTSSYDDLNRLSSRQFTAPGNTVFRIDLSYTARDYTSSVVRYDDTAGTSKVGSSSYSYDALGQLKNLQHFDIDGSRLANYTYTYDASGRVTSEKLNGSTVSYGYDAANELTSAGALSYSYDATGNRTTTGYTTGTGNQLTNDGTWAYTYDGEGNLTKKSKGALLETWLYGYDHANRMVSAKQEASDGGSVLMQATYVYDALGNRVEKDGWTQSSGLTTVTRFAYDQGNAIADLTSSNQAQARHVFLDGLDQLFAGAPANTKPVWYLPDRLGSVRDIQNFNGGESDHIDYDAYGNVTAETHPLNSDRYKWTGREQDSETGLQYNRARYYDPKVGRWTSQDPASFAAGDTNVYRYVFNGPTNAVDPSGLGWRDFLWGAGKAAGGVLVGGAIIGGAALVSPLAGAALAIGGAAYGGYQLGKTIWEAGSGEEAYSMRPLTPAERHERAGEAVVGGAALLGGGYVGRRFGGRLRFPRFGQTQGSCPPAQTSPGPATPTTPAPTPPAPGWTPAPGGGWQPPPPTFSAELPPGALQQPILGTTPRPALWPPWYRPPFFQGPGTDGAALGGPFRFPPPPPSAN